MPLWRLFYHVVWTTKRREPLVGSHRAETIVRAIKAAGVEKGVIVHAVGVMPDHVHIAASIPPSVAVSEIVGRWKGAAAWVLGHDEGRTPE